MRIIKTTGIAACAALMFTACGTNQATYVEAGGPRTAASLDQVNIQDFASAADTMVNSLIESVINTGQLKPGVPGDRAVLGISRIVNSTSHQFDTDMLVKKIRVALLKTGKVITTTTQGLGGPEDPLAANLQAQSNQPVRQPDYTLSGKILEQYTRVDNLRQSAYIFQLSLTGHDGLALWEDEKTIVKQGKGAQVGF
jgi:penicillin-binding protein activator